MANRDVNKIKRTIQDFSFGAGESRNGGGLILVDELPTLGDESLLYKLPDGTIWSCVNTEETSEWTQVNGGGGNDPYTFNLFELALYVEGKHLNVDNFIALINQMPEKDGKHIIPYIPIGYNYNTVYIGIRDDGSSTYFRAGNVSYPECYTVDDILSNKNEIESIIFDTINSGEHNLVDDADYISCNMQAYVFGETDWECLGKLTKEQLFGLFTE